MKKKTSIKDVFFSNKKTNSAYRRVNGNDSSSQDDEQLMQNELYQEDTESSLSSDIDISNKYKKIFHCIGSFIYILFLLLSFMILYLIWLSYDKQECPHI
jgi:hypothetical protein